MTSGPLSHAGSAASLAGDTLDGDVFCRVDSERAELVPQHRRSRQHRGARVYGKHVKAVGNLGTAVASREPGEGDGPSSGAGACSKIEDRDVLRHIAHD